MYSDKFDENFSDEIMPELITPQKGKLISAIVVLVFIVGVFSVAGFHLLDDDKSFSESENRVLAQMPEFSFSAIADGSFMSDFEAYLTDQFPLRDKLIAFKTFADRTMGKSEENGVYIGKEGFLFDSQTDYDEARVKEITKAVLNLSKKYPKIKKTFILAPNSSYIYSDKLPEYLELPNQRSQIRDIYNILKADKSMTWVNVCHLLENAKDEEKLLYYKTDHHWTTRAAMIVFDYLKAQWKLSPTGNSYSSADKEPKYDFYTVSTTFQGTLSSTAGVHNSFDEVEICIPQKSQGTYVVSYEKEGRAEASLFDNEKLSHKNHYEVFLGGNYDKVVITTVAQTKNTLLLIKDSYANCMIPMLTPYFNKIVVVDPRYLTDSLESIIKENEFTHMMYLYNLNTLLEDSSLVDCLAS